MARLEDFLLQNADTLGAIWFGPISLKDLIEQDRVRIAGTDTAMPFEVSYQDGSGYHTEIWTLPDAYALDKFHAAPAASGGHSTLKG